MMARTKGTSLVAVFWLIVAALSLLVAGLSGSAQAQQVGAYAQCGGINLCGGEDTDCRSCLEDFECVRQNAYYYQCTEIADSQEQLPSENESTEEESDQDAPPSMIAAAVPSDITAASDPGDFATNVDLIDDAFVEVDPVGAALSGFEEETNSEPPSIFPEEIEMPSSSSSYPLVADYQPCGGFDNHPCDLDEACAECASEDFTCQRSNAYYYQCKPSEEGEEGSRVMEVEEAEEAEIEIPTIVDVPNSNAQNETVDPNEEGNTLNASLSETSGNATMNETAAAATTSPTYPAVEDYGECGGRTMCGGEDTQCGDCSEAFACVRSNEWYWQCQPDGDAAAGEQTVNEELQNTTVGENTTMPLNGTFDGLAKTTTFFDGCKPTCAWPGNIGEDTASGPVTTCTNNFDENGVQGVNSDPNVKSICGGGGNEPMGGDTVAYACVDRSPWTENGQRYAFVAANSQCCACYELTYLATSLDGDGNVCTDCSQYGGELEGETIIVQVINSGGDLGINQFDVMVPGGGLGIYNGVVGDEAPNGEALFPDSNEEDWGERYGGVKTREECAFLPPQVRAGCEWQFDSVQNADNPGVSYKRVSCGAHPGLSRKSGCLLAKDVA